MTQSGNKGVRALWRYIGKKRIRTMKKLDESKVKWIIDQKRKGVTTKKIADTMNVSTRWVKKLWARYRYTEGVIAYLAPMGRPKNGLPGRKEHSAVLEDIHRAQI